MLHRNRGRGGIDDIGIIPNYDAVIIQDCWASYLSYQYLGHGLCGLHLLRELTFIINSNRYRWLKNIKRLLKRACKMVFLRQDKCLTDKEFLELQRIYQNILSKGEKEMPAILRKSIKGRGHIGDTPLLNERIHSSGSSWYLRR
jgi:transposase